MSGNHPGSRSYSWCCGRLNGAAGRFHLFQGLQAGRLADRGTKVDQDPNLGKVVLARIEGACPHAVVGCYAADVDVVDSGLGQDVHQRVATHVDPVECRVSGVVASLADNAVDELLSDEVGD